jgi:molybdopterin biosynthesis enzyme
MKFGPVPLDEAEGKILAHHIAGPNGGHAFRKGKPLGPGDIAALRELGRKTVFAAELEPGDIDEDTAAACVARAACGSSLSLSRPNVGRVNLQAGCLGVLQVDVERLLRLNEIEGITLATMLSHSVARPRQTVATVKVIPFAVAEERVRSAESIASQGNPLLDLQPLLPQRVSLILCGSEQARLRVEATFIAPLKTRIEALDCRISSIEYVSVEEDDLGERTLISTLRRAAAEGIGLIVLAGETAIMDHRDIAPRAIERSGGEVACFGAPVDPGNLMMVAYLGKVPVLGAPGCARSLKPNVIDWVLPRLLAGEQVGRAEILALGHGGLLGGLPEGLNGREARRDAPDGL